jgi:hypothetical protein
MNAFIIWKSSSFICEIITDGEYTPAAVTAAPKIAPEATDFSGVVDISAIPAMAGGRRCTRVRDKFSPWAPETLLFWK